MTPPRPPGLTAEQREAGRQRAVADRRTRAAIKLDLRNGRIRAGEVLDLAAGSGDRARAASRLRIAEVLLSLPGVGPAAAERALIAAGVSGQRRIGQLGPQQRDRLRMWL